MPLTSVTERTLLRRLRPLYIAAFFQGFVFFYAIEKLYMQKIGFGPDGVGLMVTLYSIVMLATETPSGVLADRWSRKGVLILASLFLAGAALIGGLSHSPGMYLVAASSWGVFFALYSGTYDSIVYDTTLEEMGNVKLFDKLYGQVKIMDSTALVTSSLLGGALAGATSLRTVYFATIPASLSAIAALLLFREPRLHKSHLDVSITEHITQTFRAVARNKQLIPIMISLVCMSTVMYMLFEFSQVWYLALAASVIYFGPANAVLLTSTGFGGLAVGRFKMARQSFMQASLLVGLVGCLGLVISRNLILTIFLQMLIATILVAILVVFNRLLHDSLSSNIRAGAASAVSTLSRMIIIPLAFVFGQIVKASSVFTAGWILVALFSLGAYFIIVVARREDGSGLTSSSD